MTSDGLGEMFEGDSADMRAGKFPLVSMGGRAEGLACADPGARTPIGASGNFGPSEVRALPSAAGINAGGHYKWHFFSLLSSFFRLIANSSRIPFHLSEKFRSSSICLKTPPFASKLRSSINLQIEVIFHFS